MVPTDYRWGAEVNPVDLRETRASQFAKYLLSGRSEGLELLNCQQAEGLEVLMVMARPPVPQRPKNDIRYEEPLAVIFPASGNSLPDVVAVRGDFPQVPHLNLRHEEYPKSLCLFAERPEELKLRWTPTLLGERILWWLKETADGTLHKEDQALEPFLGGVPRPIIIPPDLFSDASSEVLGVYSAGLTKNREVLIADRPNRIPHNAPSSRFTLFPFQLPVQQHGIIRREPRTLNALHDICSPGYDLLGELRKRLVESADRIGSDPVGTVLMLGIPKTREGGDSIESTDIFGFRCKIMDGNELIDVGPTRLGSVLKILDSAPQTIAGQQDSRFFPLLTDADDIRTASASVAVEMLMPQQGLLKGSASVLSGITTSKVPKVMAIGQGALGSQVFENLVRQGYGKWTLVDNDYYAPHNAVRHAIWGRKFGLAKAAVMAGGANDLFSDEPIARPVVTDALDDVQLFDADNEENTSLDLILDMSASVPVARHLALDVALKCKRASLFLNPNGLDLVIMVEDQDRTSPLDALECQYLRAVMNAESLSAHLSSSIKQVRYGRGCSDLSSRISQETVALHAAIGAKAVRDAVDSSKAWVSIWRCNRHDMTVNRVDLPVSPMVVSAAKGWTIVTDEELLQKVFELRHGRLPKETCGILLGYLDLHRQRIYVCDALPAPADSLEETNGCQRGIENMEGAISTVAEKTLGQVAYVGEWHSHPDNCPCRESEQDKLQMSWVAQKLHPEGKPALILIACEDNQPYFYIEPPY